MANVFNYILVPSGLISILFVCGAVLHLVGKGKRIKICLFATAGIIYLAFGNGPVAFWLLGKLENKWAPFAVFESPKSVSTIVVLTGYGYPSLRRPLSSKVNSASAFRILESLTIFNSTKMKILISGSRPISNVMKHVFISVGVPSEMIEIDDKSHNTFESAVNLKQRLGTKEFILVTSAVHMYRAVGVFKKLKMKPIPAPTDYLATQIESVTAFLPSPGFIRLSDFAVHEYLGIVWYKLRGRI